MYPTQVEIWEAGSQGPMRAEARLRYTVDELLARSA
jgi:hypothetical protein